MKLLKSKERIKATGEVFTPPALVEEMLDQLDFDWTDPTQTILEPSVGEGAFIDGLLLRLMHGLQFQFPDETERHNHIFTNMIYAIDLMADNIAYCIERFHLQDIQHHFVVADALSYHYRFDEWQPKEPELFEWPCRNPS